MMLCDEIINTDIDMSTPIKSKTMISHIQINRVSLCGLSSVVSLQFDQIVVLLLIWFPIHSRKQNFKIKISVFINTTGLFIDIFFGYIKLRE